MRRWRGLCIGAGYFSQFHFDAWRRMDDVDIVALCDRDEAKAQRAAAQFGIGQVFTDAREALDRLEIDFVDIITPPATHRALVEEAAKRGRAIICQKPLAPDYAAAKRIVDIAEEHGVRFMVHENFRFQPWHREIRRLIDQGAIGDRLHTLTFRSRPGDGWGPDAYLNRQPYFRQMPRLLIHETGVHFIDTFRFLAGQIDSVSADLRRLNGVIAGEDAGLLTCRFANGVLGVWDANRCNEGRARDPRHTFGEFLVEGNGGSIRMDDEGRLTIQPLGQPEREHPYPHDRIGFAGDCVRATQRHFIDSLASGAPFETSGREYLRTLAAVEAAYRSAETGRRVAVSEIDALQRCPESVGWAAPTTSPAVVVGTAHPTTAPNRRRVVDLSLPLDEHLPGFSIAPDKRLEREGWNTTTLTLYSHCGTHVDAPRHFVPDGATLEQQSLEVCCGPARLLDLTPVEPRELLTVAHLQRWQHDIGPGDRLLLRTDWHRRFGTPEYRHALPRISPDLARWLVERKVALIGVEPPSVADVDNKRELTEVHQILLRGGVFIVEGLAHLDQLCLDRVVFIALPLRIVGGDGCPVRAVAIESQAP
jgi:predicted dehydrogenase/kynurenine formamidase